MKVTLFRKVGLISVAVFALLALAACGGGGGGGTTSAGGGSASTSTSSTGTITGFGSVYVNGVKFDTASTSISLDGASGSESLLKVGMVVKVKGTISADGSTGSASSIKFSSDVEGPISAKDLVAKTLTVLGQTITVDDATVFEGATGLGDLTLVVGNTVEVSGFRTASGITASRVEKKTSSNIQVKGTISNLNTTATTFKLGTLTVNYGGILPQNLPTLSNGLLVEVKANAIPATAADPLIATKIEAEDTAETEGHKLEVEGYVSGFTNTTSNFKVAGQTVSVTSTTVFASGTIADLKDGAKIEAEGVLTNGVLVASKVSFEKSDLIKVNIKVEAPVEAIDANSITVLGQKFTFSALTQMEDKTGIQAKLNVGNIFSTILLGDHVAVRGFKNSAGVLIATRIERNADTKIVIQGPLAAPVSPNMTILGLSVITSSTTKFEAAGDVLISAATFFTTTPVGTIVKVTGTKTGTGTAAVITATQVEIED